MSGAELNALRFPLRQKFGEDEIRAGKMYVGASAGAAVVGPSLDPIRTLDDASAARGLVSTNAMSLVDFVVLPHDGNEKFLPRYEAIQKEYEQISGAIITHRLRATGIRDKPIAPASPWQNGFAERIIGSIRRECSGQVIVSGEANLRSSVHTGAVAAKPMARRYRLGKTEI
jgi:hypothetical protein